MYGPPNDRWDLTKIVGSVALPCDFNADDEDEVLLLFTDEGLGDLPITSVDQVKGVVTCGFVLLTRIEGRLWPVLGFLFMPYTTLAYMAAVLNVGSVEGWWLALVIAAVLVDLAHWGGGGHAVRRH